MGTPLQARLNKSLPVFLRIYFQLMPLGRTLAQGPTLGGKTPLLRETAVGRETTGGLEDNVHSMQGGLETPSLCAGAVYDLHFKSGPNKRAPNINRNKSRPCAMHRSFAFSSHRNPLGACFPQSSELPMLLGLSTGAEQSGRVKATEAL